MVAVTIEDVAHKKIIFEMARDLVEPLTEKYELQTVRTGSVFTTISETTPIEQHLDHILRVADWLVEPTV